MQSSAPDVSTYLEQARADRRDTLLTLRRLCLEHLTGCEESMEYGMPVYKRNGLGIVAFASQVQYVSLYILQKEVLDRHRPRLPKDTGKCCIRYRNPKRIDFALVATMLAEAARSTAAPC